MTTTATTTLAIAERIAIARNTRHLRWSDNGADVLRAAREELFGLSLLKVCRSKLARGDLRSNGQHGNAGVLAVMQTVDEMEAPGATATEHDGETSGQVGNGLRGVARKTINAGERPPRQVCQLKLQQNSPSGLTFQEVQPVSRSTEPLPQSPPLLQI